MRFFLRAVTLRGLEVARMLSSPAMKARAAILDVEHKLRTIEVDVPAGLRPLAALEAAHAAPHGPLGQSADAADFIFVTPERAAGLPRLAEWARDPAAGWAWDLYRHGLLGGWTPPTRDLEVFFFGDEPGLAARLAHQVVKGRKRATAGWVEAAVKQGYPLPSAGLVSIVTDGYGIPLCAIRSESVERRRFADVDAAFAAAEGEGDASLADWREGHRAYFTREAAAWGLTFDDDAVICLERFRVLAVFGDVDP